METTTPARQPKTIVVSKHFDNKISLAKHLISLYFTTVNHKCSETDKTVMAYYLVYGLNKIADNLIIKDNLSHLDLAISRQTIYNSRNFLKREGILGYSDGEGIHYFNEPFNLDFNSADVFNYAVKLSYENNKGH